MGIPLVMTMLFPFAQSFSTLLGDRRVPDRPGFSAGFYAGCGNTSRIGAFIALDWC